MTVVKKTIQEKVEEIADVICDICGSSCTNDRCGPEFALLSATWGYDSNNKDGQQHSCYFCESCYDEIKSHITDKLNGKVEIRCYMGGNCPCEFEHKKADMVVRSNFKRHFEGEHE